MSFPATAVQSRLQRARLRVVPPTRPASPRHPSTKPASASRVVETLLVVPAVIQHYGTLFGGTLMALVDEVATIAANRHAGCAAVTADASIQFLSPVQLGEVVTLEACVDWAGRTSMEVFVRISAEDPMRGEPRLCGTAFLTFVGTDATGGPCPVPSVQPDSELAHALFAQAPARLAARRQARQDLANLGRALAYDTCTLGQAST